MSLPLATIRTCQYAAFAGVISHWAYFMHGEHHMEAPQLTLLFFISPLLLFFVESLTIKDDIFASAVRAGAIYLSFSLPLWTSIFLYRAFFHRLRGFPGPFMNKVTKLWHMSKVGPKADNYLYLDALYKKYGDFVRTGPTEISVFHPEGVQALLAPGSKCTKSPWYDISKPLTSLHTERIRAVHDKRRKVWDKGFGAKALRGYEDRVVGFSKTLIDRISQSSGRVINATVEFQYFAFDIMGDVAFGKSFGMMESGKSHFALKVIKEGMAPLGALTPVPWLLHVLTKIPGAANEFWALLKWCSEQVESRRKIQAEMKVPDVMSYLVETFEKSSKTDADHQLLNGDSRLIVVAGSDTTSATLTNLIYHLAVGKGEIEKLRAELDPIMPIAEGFNHKDIQSVPHLNAVINETLRLHPPVPAGVFRLTPPEGIKIGDTYIPGNVTVIAPFYTVHRRTFFVPPNITEAYADLLIQTVESCYEYPHDFIPERWYSKPELIKNPSTFAPFSLGPYSCVGKQLALMELRTVVALIVSHFDVELAPGEDGKPLMNELRDCFTVEQADLKVIFTPRQRNA